MPTRAIAAIASIAATPELRAKVDFTDPYYRTPARFVARRDSPIEDPLPERLEGKKVRRRRYRARGLS
jgi:polar amino acid transport system substrate-binding protein